LVDEVEAGGLGWLVAIPAAKLLIAITCLEATLVEEGTLLAMTE